VEDTKQCIKKVCVFGKLLVLMFCGVGSAAAYVQTKRHKRQKKGLEAVLTLEGKTVLEVILAAEGKEARDDIMAAEAIKGLKLVDVFFIGTVVFESVSISWVRPRRQTAARELYQPFRNRDSYALKWPRCT
jgi:hypothetical protein